MLLIPKKTPQGREPQPPLWEEPNITKEEFDARNKARSKVFQSKWESILAKYAAVPEEDQGDLIDLITGEVVEDNGHLRSMETAKESDIWNLDFCETIPQKIQLARKIPPYELKSPISLDNLSLLGGSPPKRFHRPYKPAGIDSDDLMLLSTSPGKRLHKVSNTASPLKRGKEQAVTPDAIVEVPTKRFDRRNSEGITTTRRKDSMGVTTPQRKLSSRVTTPISGTAYAPYLGGIVPSISRTTAAITGSREDLTGSAVSSVRFYGRTMDIEPQLPPPEFLLKLKKSETFAPLAAIEVIDLLSPLP
ncbi:hypothetical protein BABINDRAFT_166119 [Babjeviella inositovora NRRL Y-12698]|uniref:Uncharacterized protein n=1 Tax=Babjeviella inositovora NRRL Y-12698 TaxID=984486 RepID=A0A1E3QS56_9ASCO|nr:uncharacterized protein BABINDRAFT_166119 [Babjeviella inositovora NRRL Y-12698]ODQ80500.1 hypothetical protein BABINDRAFT_166119 [Babjeviella inositovora NRRL Y-12698]